MGKNRSIEKSVSLLFEVLSFFSFPSPPTKPDAMPARDAGMAYAQRLLRSISSEETDDSAGVASSSPSPGPGASSSSSSSLQQRRSRSLSSSKRLKDCSVPAAAVHVTAAVLVARVHSELAYAPASRAPEAAHALCLVLDAALRCKSGGGIGGGERREGESLSSSSFSPSAFSSLVSIAKVGAPTELPDAAFVAVALPAKATTTMRSSGVGGNSSSSSASEKERSESSSEGERSAANAAAAAAASAASGGNELTTAPLVAALLRAAERLHAAVAQVLCCF